MSAVVVALMVLLIALIGLAAVLLATQALKKEVDQARAERGPRTSDRG